MFRRKQTCVGCHFFAKEARALPSAHPITTHVSPEERGRAASGDFSWVSEAWALMCHFGVWDEGYNFDKVTQRAVIVDAERRGFCFYWPYRSGMLFPAAKVLQEREARDRDAARDRRLTIWGLWIAALALVAGVFAQVATALKWWPFR